MSFSFFTIEKKVEEIILKEKGSKFISYAYPVSDEEEIKKELENLWTTHPEATHICYAYRLGLSGQKYRTNDDGEPSGSAGLPIYNQILSKGITNVLVACVRYFGGTKLGVGGLVKTYKLSAQMVLDEIKIVEKHLTQKILFDFSYEDQGNVMRNIDKFQAEVLKTEFTEKCKMIVRVRKDHLKNFLSAFEAFYQVQINLI